MMSQAKEPLMMVTLATLGSPIDRWLATIATKVANAETSAISNHLNVRLESFLELLGFAV
jgi:hypothetical protein